MEYAQNSLFEYSLSKIKNYSQKPDSTDEEYVEVSSLTFDYNNEALMTEIIDKDFNSERYLFDENGVKKEYYQIFNNCVSKAECYSYTPYERQEKFVYADDVLNKYTYEEFTGSHHLCLDGNYDCGHCSECSNCSQCNQDCIEMFHKNYSVVTELNNYNLPTKVTENNVYITDTATKTTVTEYEYDDELKTTKETTSETYSNGNAYKSVTSYTYESSTQRLKKKETIIYHVTNGSDVKELTNIEEYTYDSNGCVSITKSYRRAGASTTVNNYYYSQKTYNNYKQVTSEYDETGLYNTGIEYATGTNLVSKVTAPHNNIINYSYDSEGRIARMWGAFVGTENGNTTEYNSGEIEKLNHSGDNAIEYEYDAKRRPIKIIIGGNTYETYEYEDNISMGWYYGDKVTVTNANGERFGAEVDYYGIKEKAYYNDALILQRDYDYNGRLRTVSDKLYNINHEYEYDSCGNLKQFSESRNGTTVNKEVYAYNGKAQVSSVTYSGAVTRTDIYEYSGNALDYITKVTTGVYTVTPAQDVDERYTGKTVKIGNTVVDVETVTYVKQGDHATQMPNQITYPNTSIFYMYDGNGNIKQIMQDGVLQAIYTYDTLGRLVREDNNVLGESYFFIYDNNGNLLAREKCPFTTGSHTIGTGTVTSYTYNKDKMTNYGTQSCVYDAVGNPTIYRGKTATWTRGRKLISYDGNRFDYDAQGMRIRKNRIVFCYDSNGRLLKQSNGLEFFYDTTGLVGLTYRGNSYVYRKDMQGNIIAILDRTGNVVVRYKYDAWGNHKVLDASGNVITDASHIGNLNPFRYRSYYFDVETELYFLKTRYYDPEIGRFINMDSIDYADTERINGLNLFAYCDNNPVMGYDPDGTWDWGKFWRGVGMIVTAVTAVALAVTTFGAGIPLVMTVAAGITLAAGVLTGVNGLATVIEAGTEYNFVRDGVFQGNETAYNWYAGITEGVAAVGSMILGAYHCTGQYKAAKYGQKFLGKGYKKAGYTNAGTPRYVSKDGLRQMRFDNPHMYKGEMIGKHLNLEIFKGTKPSSYEHVLYNLFKYWIK